MSVRSFGYDSENLDQIFCYFMRTILHLQNSGVEDLPLENHLAEPCKPFLNTAMEILFSASPSPELSRLALDSEHDVILSRGQLTIDLALSLRLIKQLAWHIHYDGDYYEYLFTTENLWGNTALEYATFTFYPNLPEEIKRQYHIHDLMKYIPENKFRLEDY